jgi:uncharacterized protein YegJ (DUF2314 family)
VSYSTSKFVAKLALAGFLSMASLAHAEDKVVDFSKADPVMNAAIEKARGSLPQFWTMFAAPQSGIDDFSLKLAVTDEQGTEHFWCSEIEGNADKASCRIANEPQIVQNVAMGQRVDVDPAIISDWMYQKDGKIVGAQTLRVIVKTMPPEEAEQYKAMLADE